jgi:hypothetical protein
MQYRDDLLRSVTRRELDAFFEQGYFVYKAEAVAAFRADVVRTLRDISLKLLAQLQVDTSKLADMSYEELIGWCLRTEEDQRFTRLFYEMYQSTAAVIGLIDHPLPLFLARSVGVRTPIPGTLPTIRIDRPGVTKYLTKAHQDYWYSLISERAVVLWMPIIPLSRDMGLLGVVPASQKLGFQPFEDRGAYTFTLKRDYSEAEYVECEMETDEMLVFNQFLVHRSGVNNGRMARVTMQLRYNDLEAMAEVAPTFTAVSSKFVLERQKALLAGNGAAACLGARRATSG